MQVFLKNNLGLSNENSKYRVKNLVSIDNLGPFIESPRFLKNLTLSQPYMLLLSVFDYHDLFT